jgi:hypothetical protein
MQRLGLIKFASCPKVVDTNTAAVLPRLAAEILECDLLPFHFRRVFTGALKNLIERENYE